MFKFRHSSFIHLHSKKTPDIHRQIPNTKMYSKLWLRALPQRWSNIKNTSSLQNKGRNGGRAARKRGKEKAAWFFFVFFLGNCTRFSLHFHLNFILHILSLTARLRQRRLHFLFHRSTAGSDLIALTFNERTQRVLHQLNGGRGDVQERRCLAGQGGREMTS